MTGEKGPNREELVKELEYVFMEVGKRIHATVAQGMEPSITSTQYFMMQRLVDGAANVSEIAEYLGVSLSAVTSLSDRLVKTGLICRKRDENDRRLVYLELTDKGRETFEGANVQRQKVLNFFLENLSDEEIATLSGIYKKTLGIFRQGK